MQKSKEEINHIHEKIKQLYINKNIEEAKELLLKEEKYIDIGFKNGSFLEFAAIHKDERKAVENLNFLINLAKKNNQLKNLKNETIHNILLTAIICNQLNVVKWCVKEQKICEIDFSYDNYGIIKNCCPKNENKKKLEILIYLITDANLKKNKEIENILKKQNKLDYLEYFEKYEYYQQIEKKLSNHTTKSKKIKI